ncbi:MAG: hypothetical protein ACM3UZ_09005, partial [Acidobacteriota bacterium]
FVPKRDESHKRHSLYHPLITSIPSYAFPVTGETGGAYWINRSVRSSGVIFGFRLLVPGLHRPRLAKTLG